MIEQLIEYVMKRANECYSDDFPIQNIETWIREFFDITDLKSEWGGTARCITSDGRNVNMAEELNRLEKLKEPQ